MRLTGFATTGYIYDNGQILSECSLVFGFYNLEERQRVIEMERKESRKSHVTKLSISRPRQFAHAHTHARTHARTKGERGDDGQKSDPKEPDRQAYCWRRAGNSFATDRSCARLQRCQVDGLLQGLLLFIHHHLFMLNRLDG